MSTKVETCWWRMLAEDGVKRLLWNVGTRCETRFDACRRTGTIEFVRCATRVWGPRRCRRRYLTAVRWAVVERRDGAVHRSTA